MGRIVCNLLGFHFVWWTCVLFARAGRQEVGLGAAILFAVAHLAQVRRPASELRFLLTAAALGYAVDAAATFAGALRFPPDARAALLPPPWIAALWLVFATTLTTSLRWLRDRPAAAALIGALGGPAAYAAGNALDVVWIDHWAWSTMVLAVGWGALLPVLAWLAPTGGALKRAPSPVVVPRSEEAA